MADRVGLTVPSSDLHSDWMARSDHMLSCLLGEQEPPLRRVIASVICMSVSAFMLSCFAEQVDGLSGVAHKVCLTSCKLLDKLSVQQQGW